MSRSSHCYDIRLTDFANAKLPKSSAKRLSKNSKLLEKQSFVSALPDHEENYEPDLEPVKTADENDQISQKPDDSLISYAQYSIDFWNSVSRQISPENVCRFALICRQTLQITRSVQFWKHLFKKYYKLSKLSGDFPERFGHICVEKNYGLRSCVIKGLFWYYQPFADRLKRDRYTSGVSLDGKAIEKLCRGICESFWFETSETTSRGKLFTFFLKFSPIASKLAFLTHQKNERENSTDIFANLECDCYILKIITTSFTNVPHITNWRMCEFSISLSSDMRTHRLKMKFEPKMVKKYANQMNNQGKTTNYSGPKEMAVFEGVQSLALLDWWHPKYPLPIL